MGFHVTLRPSGHEFEVDDGKTILGAALAAGCNLPYSCRAGSCTTCRARIVRGRVDYGKINEYHLTATQREAGGVLLCQATPLSDLEIEAQELTLHLSKPRLVPCRVKRIDRPAPDVAIIGLRLPYNDNMLYAAGQYVDFLLPDGRRRSYSIATAPDLEGFMMDIDLHIRHTPGGAFTDHVFNTLKAGEILRFEGPLGTFYLREDSDKPILFLAGGTGFAPIKAIIEYALKRKILRPMTLYWGCRARRDLYMAELAEQWADSSTLFRFVPVLSEPEPGDAWSGRMGLVHEALMNDFPDLSGCEVYSSGTPAMVEAARRDFIQRCGLPADSFFADSFLTEADLASAEAGDKT